MSVSTYPATIQGRLSSVLLAAALASVPAGCGLHHYQEQMAEEQKRLERLEDEDKKLDDPALLPEKKGRPTYFFRPPKDIGSSGMPHESSVLQRFGARPNSLSPFQDVAFGVEHMKAEDFWSSLLRSFPGKKIEEARDVFIDPPGRPKLAFKELKSDDNQAFAYVWSQGETTHAAVIYRLTRPIDEDTRKRMDISLGTLTVEGDAARLLRAFKERKTHAAQAAVKRKARSSSPDP